MDMPPKPKARPDSVSLWRYARLFRRDILSAQPDRLYGAWMAAFRTPFFSSYLVNQPDLVKLVLRERPDDFPKSDRVSEGLRPLLGNSIFLSNGETWKRQRRIIDPAFEGGRLRDSFPAMQAAAVAMAQRLKERAGEIVEVEAEMSHVTADVIFRALFSIPIEDKLARAVFEAFRRYQRSAPILNLAALVPLPRWFPRRFPRETRDAAQEIRALLTKLCDQRQAQIDAGTAPDDLATKIMTTLDPQTGGRFSTEEMVDQVAIFFLAGHETSAAALSWALYLLAAFPEWQSKLADEAAMMENGFAGATRLSVGRDVFRETLRLYPPVPMMVRSNQQPERFRNREISEGSQIVLSPWHLQRHRRLWDNPDGFDPSRWKSEAGQKCARDAFIPFGSGARVCPGAGFAMLEGPLILAHALRDLRVKKAGRTPVPVAHLTVRSRDGIHLRFDAR